MDAAVGDAAAQLQELRLNCLVSVLVYVCVGFLLVYWFPPTSQNYASRWTGYANLPQV